MSDTRDSLEEDLNEIINDSFADKRLTQDATIKQLLMTKLVPYIVRRDHKVWNAGYNTAKQGGKNAETKTT